MTILVDNTDKANMRTVVLEVLRGLSRDGADGEHLVIGALAGVREFVEEAYGLAGVEKELDRLADQFKS